MLTLLLLYPVRIGITRPAILASSLLIYALLLLCLWKKRPLRYILLTLAALPMIFVSLPGRPADSTALQSTYTSTLRSYTHTRYVWGGENHLGVDCSGLIRAAMVDTQFKESIATLNPTLLRESAWLWWNDIAARDMPAGYNNRLLPLFSSDKIRQSGLDSLHPGDLAATADGSHVFAYLGNNRWIEADPISLRVTEWNTADRPAYLDRPLTFLRWRCLE